MKTFRSPIVLIVVAMLFVASASTGQAEAGKHYHYKRIDVAMTIHTDSTIDVEERQTFVFTGNFHEARRVIPLKRIDAITDVVVVDAATGQTLIKAWGKQDKLSPSSWGRYRTWKKDGQVFIQWFFNATDEDRSWIIRYKIHGALEFLPGSNRLYWNIFSSYDEPVSSVNVRVAMPQGYEAGDAAIAAYRTNGLAIRRSEIAQERAIVFSSQGFSPRQALTIDIRWQKGRIAAMAYWKDILFLYYGYAIATLAVLLGLLIVVARWYWAEHRLRGKGTIIARYEPPQGLPPAMIETLLREKVTNRGLTATIVDLSVRGYTHIAEDPERRLSWSAYAAIQKKRGRATVIAMVVFWSIIALAWIAGIGWALLLFSQGFVDKTGMMVVEMLYQFIAFGIPAFSIFLLVHYINRRRDYTLTLVKPIDDPTLRSYERRYLTILFPSGRLFSTREFSYAGKLEQRSLYESVRALKEAIQRETEQATNAYAVGFTTQRKQDRVHGAMIIVLLVFLIAYWIFSPLSFFSPIPQWVVAAAALVIVGVRVRSFILYDARLSPKGAILKEELLGFRQYLHTAERFRLQNLTPEFFERYLPYAMVFGVEKHWARAFAAMALVAPAWYTGSAAGGGITSTGGGFSSSAFSASFASSFHGAFSGSGGGGGGGGAGGGGGGGGGGAS